MLDNITLIFIRQEHLCLWQRPDDAWVGTSCYEWVKQMVGDLAHGEAVRITFTPVQVERIGKRRLKVHDGED